MKSTFVWRCECSCVCLVKLSVYVCLSVSLRLCVCVCICMVCACVYLHCIGGLACVYLHCIGGLKWTYAVKYEIVSFSVQNYTESTDKSQNIVEQANSNPNNTSLTMSRRHIICNSSILTEWTSSLTPNKIRTYSKVEVEKYNESEESQILAVFPT